MTTESTEAHLWADRTVLARLADGPPLLSGRDWFLSRPPDRRANGAAKDPTPAVNWAKFAAAMHRAYAEPIDEAKWRREWEGHWPVADGPAEPVPSS